MPRCPRTPPPARVAEDDTMRCLRLAFDPRLPPQPTCHADIAIDVGPSTPTPLSTGLSAEGQRCVWRLRPTDPALSLAIHIEAMDVRWDMHCNNWLRISQSPAGTQLSSERLLFDSCRHSYGEPPWEQALARAGATCPRQLVAQPGASVVIEFGVNGGCAACVLSELRMLRIC